LKIFKLLTALFVCAIALSLCSISVSAEGWGKTEDGKSYFELKDKKKLTGFNNIDGSVYYFDKNGNMLTGHQTINGYKYCFASNGKIMTGWQKTSSGDTMYYAPSYGVRYRGFCEIDNSTYYFQSNGVMLKGGSYKINEKTYTFGEDGKLSDKTPYKPETFADTLIGLHYSDSLDDVYATGILGDTEDNSSAELNKNSLYRFYDMEYSSVKNGDKYYISQPVIWFDNCFNGTHSVASLDITYYWVNDKDCDSYAEEKANDIKFDFMEKADIDFVYDYYAKLLNKAFYGESPFYAKPLNNLHVYSSKKSNTYTANPAFLKISDIKSKYNLDKLSVYSNETEMVYLFTDDELVALVSVGADYSHWADDAFVFELFYKSSEYQVE
jgi:glucan-binding repeat-containing protein